ncbi:hypothetical protein FNF27_06875 [Cafeteria roenbergensis]|uniref:CBM20 domain-containing protein n=1 Tax=Cafeteria roenbergensis TaxID=33653 RepID=A0A5A8DYC6_CAFRO|nr:hypothetical protein FNF27_06875 [Cafeteria roenbergensis]
MASTCAPVDFVWPHVAKSVRVTGEFCGWNEGVPMTKRDDGVFVARVTIEVGRKIAYKFICNGAEWKYDPAQPWEADAFSNINNVVQVLPSDGPAAAATATTTGTAVVTTADGSAAGASGDHASIACTAGSPGRAQAPSAPAAEPSLPSPRLQAMSEPFLAWATPSEAISAARHLPRVDPLRAAQAADERMTQAEFGLDPAALIRQQQAIKRSRSAAEMRRLGETDGFASGGEAEPFALPGGLHDALAELDMPEMDPDAQGAAGVSEGGPLGRVAAQPGPLVGPAALAAEAAAASGGGGGSGDVGRGAVADGEAASAAAGAAGAGGAPRARQASPGETGTEASSRREGKLVLAMVGLPARGKTSIAFKLRRHLNWMGMRTEIYNVGNYRRKLLGAGQEHGFFDPANAAAMAQRQAMAEAALDDMVLGLRTKLDVAIFDATNTTRERRAWLRRRLDEEFSDPPEPGCEGADGGAEEASGGGAAAGAERDWVDVTAAAAAAEAPASGGGAGGGAGGQAAVRPRARAGSNASATSDTPCADPESRCQLVFIESICTDEEMIRANVRETKLKSPDYKDMTEQEAVKDFLRRIGHYVAVYQSVEDDEDCAYVKLIDVGRKLVAHRMAGFLKARLLFFLSNLRIAPKPIWVTRHGESEFNVRELIGGDSSLSSRGVAYARRLGAYMDKHYPPGTPLTVWTSTLRRTQQTASFLKFHRPIAWRNLDEIDAGICDGRTYEWIAKHMPKEYEARKNDKYRYRYPQGESYQDLAQRLEPIMLELERIDTPILIIAHQAILRVILGYLHDKDPQQCPSLSVPLHTLTQVTPKAYGVEEVRISLG